MDVYLKLALVVFLILATAFADVEVMDPSLVSKTRKNYGDLAIATMVLVTALGFYFIFRRAMALLFPPGYAHGSVAKVLFRFRDVIAAQSNE